VGSSEVPRGRLFLLVGSDALVAERNVSPSITHDTPLRGISIPTNRATTQRPERGHCLRMGVPRRRKGRPCRGLQKVLDWNTPPIR
jgi:hypothetical protein